MQRNNILRNIDDRSRNGSVNYQGQMLRNIMNSRDLLGRLKIKNRFNLKTCRNCALSWSPDGQLLLSGSTNRSFSILNPFDRTYCKISTQLNSSAHILHFLPNDGNRHVLAAWEAGPLVCYDLNSFTQPERRRGTAFLCHIRKYIRALGIMPSMPNIFFSGGDDKAVCRYDTLASNACSAGHQLIRTEAEVTALSIAPISCNYIAVGCKDQCVRVFDIRNAKLLDGKTIPVQSYRIPKPTHDEIVTSLMYDPSEKYILANFAVNHVYLFDIAKYRQRRAHYIAMNYRPAINQTNVFYSESCFWGDNYILAGSNNGRTYIFERQTYHSKLTLRDEVSTVNCVKPNPTQPMLATVGNDSMIRCWTPGVRNRFDKITYMDDPSAVPSGS